MPTPERISDELLLAATERAERHKRGEEPGVLIGQILKHLGLMRGSWSTRRVRPQLEELYGAGFLERVRKRGTVVWLLTTAGRQRLEAARKAGTVGELPESPQHQVWREARERAGSRIEHLSLELRLCLEEAVRRLAAGEETHSETWFEFAERLHESCWNLASATYCLGEWTEPDDAVCDVDQPPPGQRARRETRRWDAHAGG